LAQTTEGSNHQEYLYQILSEELHYRDITRTQMLVVSAGFYTINAFEVYRFDEITLPSDLTSESLKPLRLFTKNKNLIMYCGTGTGSKRR